MVGSRKPVLLAAVGVVVLCAGLVCAVGSAWAEAEERAIMLDVRDADLEDTLRLVFKDTPYSFTLESGITARKVTLSLNNVTFSQALRAILEMHDLTYRKEGRIYHIVREPEPVIVERPPVEEVRSAPRQNIYWFGPGGRYELQYLDCRLVAGWFGGSEIASSLIPIPVTGGATGAGGGGFGGSMGGGGFGGAAGGMSMGGGSGGSRGGGSPSGGRSGGSPSGGRSGGNRGR